MSFVKARVQEAAAAWLRLKRMMPTRKVFAWSVGRTTTIIIMFKHYHIHNQLFDCSITIITKQTENKVKCHNHDQHPSKCQNHFDKSKPLELIRIVQSAAQWKNASPQVIWVKRNHLCHRRSTEGKVPTQKVYKRSLSATMWGSEWRTRFLSKIQVYLWICDDLFSKFLILSDY